MKEEKIRPKEIFDKYLELVKEDYLFLQRNNLSSHMPIIAQKV